MVTKNPNKLQIIDCISQLSIRANELKLPELAIILEVVAQASILDEDDELRFYTDAFTMHKMLTTAKNPNLFAGIFPLNNPKKTNNNETM